MSDRLDRIRREWDRTAVSDWYMGYRTDEVVSAILRDPSTAFHPATWALLRRYIPDMEGKDVLVPSSGDNRAVFALAALGARVTSCDISEKQLELAGETARRFGLDIRFRQEDTMRLAGVADGAYDLVYTSEGVHVWIDDLDGMYASVFRVLRPGGIYCNYELHPFCRPFAYDDGKPQGKEIVVRKDYDAVGPFDEGTTYLWRLGDILSAAAGAGLRLLRLEEMHDDPQTGHFWFYEAQRARMTEEEKRAYYDLRRNPLAALPQWFSMAATKDA